MILNILLLLLSCQSVNYDYIVVKREWMFYVNIDQANVSADENTEERLGESEAIEGAKTAIKNFAATQGFLVPRFVRCSRHDEIEKWHWQVTFTSWYDGVQINDWLTVGVSDAGDVNVYGYLYRLQSAGMEKECRRVGKLEAESILEQFVRGKLPGAKYERPNLGLVWHYNPLVKTEKNILRKYWKDSPLSQWDGVANLVSSCDGEVVPESVN